VKLSRITEAGVDAALPRREARHVRARRGAKAVEERFEAAARSLEIAVDVPATLVDRSRGERRQRVLRRVVVPAVERALDRAAHAADHAREQRVDLVTRRRIERYERRPLFVGRGERGASRCGSECSS
jgi:L-lysine 2,3-aminomutase